MKKSITKKISNLYKQTSRQQALFTKLLPSNLHVISIDYYLLYRILDTVEDSNIPIDIKTNLLKNYSNNFIESIKITYDKINTYNIKNNYLNLIQNYEDVIELHLSLSKKVQKKIEEIGLEMASGMLKYIEKMEMLKKNNDKYLIKNLEELDDYCYYAAGCVGKLNSKLFCLYKAIDDINDEIITGGIELGRYLQIVNIIRDNVSDNKERDFNYFPEEFVSGNKEEQLLEIIAFARQKEKIITNYLRHITNKKVLNYCFTLYDIAKKHFDYYEDNKSILTEFDKPNSLTIFKSLPLKLKIYFVLYKIKKYWMEY